jgi:hypothetical protein
MTLHLSAMQHASAAATTRHTLLLLLLLLLLRGVFGFGKELRGEDQLFSACKEQDSAYISRQPAQLGRTGTAQTCKRGTAAEGHQRATLTVIADVAALLLLIYALQHHGRVV